MLFLCFYFNSFLIHFWQGEAVYWHNDNRDRFSAEEEHWLQPLRHRQDGCWIHPAVQQPGLLRRPAGVGLVLFFKAKMFLSSTCVLVLQRWEVRTAWVLALGCKGQPRGRNCLLRDQCLYEKLNHCDFHWENEQSGLKSAFSQSKEIYLSNPKAGESWVLSLLCPGRI